MHRTIFDAENGQGDDKSEVLQGVKTVEVRESGRQSHPYFHFSFIFSTLDVSTMISDNERYR